MSKSGLGMRAVIPSSGHVVGHSSPGFSSFPSLYSSEGSVSSVPFSSKTSLSGVSPGVQPSGERSSPGVPSSIFRSSSTARLSLSARFSSTARLSLSARFSSTARLSLSARFSSKARFSSVARFSSAARFSSEPVSSETGEACTVKDPAGIEKAEKKRRQENIRKHVSRITID